MRIFIHLLLTKCVEDFNWQYNMFFANFKYVNSYARNVLFHKYCTAFYGSQILPLFNNCMDDVYIIWTIAMCKGWRLSWTTHCNLLPNLADVMDLELWFSKSYVKLIKKALNSDNIIVRTITNVFLNGTLLRVVIGDIWGLNMEWKNVMLWNVGMKSVRMRVNLSDYVNI